MTLTMVSAGHWALGLARREVGTEGPLGGEQLSERVLVPSPCVCVQNDVFPRSWVCVRGHL